jgi:murein DD-endopeptidase MepM/ murein hydrolase activator NlpD
MLRRRLTLATFLLASSLLAVPASADTGRDDLRGVQARLGQVRAVLNDTRADAGQITRALRAADQALAAATRSLADARKRASLARTRTKIAARRLAVVERETVDLQAEMNARARETYTRGIPGPLVGFNMLIEARTVNELTEREVAMHRIANRDNTTFQRLLESRRILADLRTRLAAEERERVAAANDLQAQVAKLAEVRRVRAEAKRRLDARVQLLRREADQLAADSARIAAIIRRQEAAARARAQAIANREAAASARAGRRNRRTGEGGGLSSSGLRWPASCGLTSGFGARWGRMHEGIDLGCPSGTSVRAARGGVVLAAGWGGGYGKLVLIGHGDGLVTAYGHNSRLLVSAGQSVERGQVIAASGSTGHSTGPHVHFEVRVGGVPRNPLAYLP